VNASNCVDPYGRVVSYLLTFFLRSLSLMYKEREERFSQRHPLHCNPDAGVYQNGDQRAICNKTRGIDAGSGVIRPWGVSGDSDGARPL
jgi:hypothetical protein